MENQKNMSSNNKTNDVNSNLSMQTKDSANSIREKKKFFKPRFKDSSDYKARDSRESREPREIRESREPREYREPREPREGRESREGEFKKFKGDLDETSKRPAWNRASEGRFKPRESFNKDYGETKDGTKKPYTRPIRNQEEKTKRISNPQEKGNLSFHRDLRDGVIVNREIQKQSLNPHHKLDLNTKARVRITPLGGLGEIGGNMTVFETEDCAIIVDIGMSFPDNDTHGVDILIPDFTYIEQIKHKIIAVIITHAHEDHIGAVPYFYKHYSFPLYGTPLVLGLVGNKFDEHGLRKSKELFRIVEKRTPIIIGDFEIEWIHITHSVIDSSALAIKTNAGIILHTGDFKIDHTPIDDLPTDLHRLAYYGEKGVLLMLSDSTNSHKSGITASEASVGPTFDALFKDSKGRVIMSTFSSNIHRVYQAIKYGIKYNRKVAVIGRSMEKNIDIARELEYIDIPSKSFIEAHEVNNYDDSEVLIVTTGSQGETMSALYRMATDEHRHVKIKHTDTIILSAKAIPGNEGSVSSVINLIMKAGARVAYQDFSEIHVSGHAAKEEQKLMLRLIKPKFFLPVHGEYNHIAKHKETAISCGVLEKNIYLMEDGDQIEVNPNYMRKVKSVRSGKVFIDNQINKVVDNEVVAHRSLIANNGILILSMRFNSAQHKLIDIRLNTFGLLNKLDEKEFYKSMIDDIKLKIDSLKHARGQKALDQELYSFLRKSLFKKFKKSPMIIVNVFSDDKSYRDNRSREKDSTENTRIEGTRTENARAERPEARKEAQKSIESKEDITASIDEINSVLDFK